MGFNRRFDPEILRLRECLPPEVELDLTLELHYRRKAWNSFDMRDDALLDLGPHLIDLARWLTGAGIRQVCTRILHPRQAVFQVELERGRAIIACSNNRPHTERVKVKDVRGRVMARHTRGGAVAGILARLQPTRPNPLVNSLVGQVEAFARLVRGDDGARLATAADGLAVMFTIDAVRRSAMKGGAVCRVDCPGEMD